MCSHLSLTPFCTQPVRGQSDCQTLMSKPNIGEDMFPQVLLPPGYIRCQLDFTHFQVCVSEALGGSQLLQQISYPQVVGGAQVDGGNRKEPHEQSPHPRRAANHRLPAQPPPGFPSIHLPQTSEPSWLLSLQVSPWLPLLASSSVVECVSASLGVDLPVEVISVGQRH